MKRVLKWAGISVGGTLVALLLVLGGAMGFTRSHMNRTYRVDPAPLVRSDRATAAELAARGARLLRVRGCVDCHGTDLGGSLMADDPAVGRLWAANLTRGTGGVAASYAGEKDWVRSIRHGIGPDGKPLVFMPSHEFYPIGDDDLAAMIAALRAAPPVDREDVGIRAGPLAALLYMTGRMALLPAELIDHDAPRPATPEPASTPEYGAYLSAGCVGCHGMTLSGGKIPGGPPGTPIPANITPDEETGIGSWTQEDFVRLLREGIRPDGRKVAEFMPVAFTKEFTDMELEAMWKYLRTVEPKPFGDR